MAIKITNDFDYQRGGFSPGAWPRARAMCLMIHKMREVAIREINGALIDDYSKTYMELHTNKVVYFSNGISQGKVSGISSFFGNPSVRIEYLREGVKCLKDPIVYEVAQIKPKSLLRIGEKLAKIADECPKKEEIDTVVSQNRMEPRQVAGLELIVFEDSVSVSLESFSANLRFRNDREGGTTVIEGLWYRLAEDLRRCDDFQRESLLRHFSTPSNEVGMDIIGLSAAEDITLTCKYRDGFVYGILETASDKFKKLSDRRRYCD
jgi:hypothetical protein